jgi:Carboxypeptidase regulatory-like domain
MEPGYSSKTVRDKSVKTRSVRTSLAAYTIAILLLVSPSFGQMPGTGAISGIVYDPATRAVANAEVSAINEATGVSRSVKTSSEGVFSVPLLLPGSYTPGREPNI